MKPGEHIITVDRYKSELDWTLSEFYILPHSPKRAGFGVEDEERLVKLHGETRIDNGLYEFTFQPSPHFSKEYFVDANGNLSKVKDDRFNTPHLLLTLLNVPKFDRVLWHWGNTDDDTDACYLVGSYLGPVKTKHGIQEGVISSRIKYLEIYPILYRLWKANKAAGLKCFVLYKNKWE